MQALGPSTGGGTVIWTRSSAGTWFDAADVPDAVAAEAIEPGNVRKLAAADADVRALFV